VDQVRRAHEMQTIADWMNSSSSEETDFLIVGDRNIKNASELTDFLPDGFASLNFDCVQTNTQPDKPKPYSHVVYQTTAVDEVDDGFGFQVVDLITAMKATWPDETTYPGEPYKGNLFGQYYSDHCPVVFQLTMPETDDD